MTHRNQRNAEVRTVRKLSRLGTPMEPLEPRQLMSAVTLATPTTVTAAATSPTSVNVSWAESTKIGTGYTVLRSTNGGDYSAVGHVTGATVTKFADTTVLPNKTYGYKVEAIATGKTTSASVAATVKTPLIAPTALTATLASGHITLGWTDNDTTATGYYVSRSVNGGAFTQIANVTSKTADSTTDSNAISGQSYRYEVQAYGVSNTSAVTAPVTIVTPLSAPSSLSAAATSSANDHLTWTDNDSNATGYLVLRSTDGTHYSTLSKITTAGTVSFDDKSVSAFTTYYYEVEATTAAATSAASSPASTKTPLAVPSAVTLVSTTPTSVALKWTDTDAAAQGYFVLRSSGGSSFTQVGQTTSGKTTSFTDNSVSSNTTYSYEIESYNGNILSAATTAFPLTTPLITPTGLQATTLNGTSVQLAWTDNDTTATGYIVQRSTDGKAFVNINTISSGTADSYTDTVASGHMYCYSLIATAGNNSSGMASLSTTVTPLVAPSGLTATATSATSIQVSWTKVDPATTGYKVMRSTDGSTYTLLTTITTATTTTLLDKTALSNHTYYYEVQAINGSFSTSAMTGAASATTPMLAPSKLVAAMVGTNVNLSWTNNDSTTTGYTISRSTDGVNFTQLATLNSATTTTYADTTASAGQKYYYEVQATDGSLTSVVSNIVTATAVTPSTSTVTVTTRYGDELVITATGADDSVSLSESGGTVTITADGTTTTDPAPAAGVFVYTRGGADGINVASSVTTRTTIETVDTGVDDITSAGGNVSAWIDATDIYTGTGTVHSVSSFAGGVAKTTGAALADPKDAGKTMKMTTSLWGTGPSRDDIYQGGVGDCYFLSSLAAFAGEKPSVLMESAVDMGDGTYTVQFINAQNKPVFVRVSNDISTGAYWGYGFARPGADGDVWALVMEKAFADFRTGANTYASISSGWMGEVYADLGQASQGFSLSGYTESQFYTMVSTDLANGKAVTFGTSNAPDLVSGHAYTLVSCSIDANGITSYVVRNPWGMSGDSLENSQGYATLTFAQMQANFVDGCQAL